MTCDVRKTLYGMVCQTLSNDQREERLLLLTEVFVAVAGKVVCVHALPERCRTTAQSRYRGVPTALASPEHRRQHVPLRLDH